MAKKKVSFRDNIFHHLSKKILQNSEFSINESDDGSKILKLSCLGHEEFYVIEKDELSPISKYEEFIKTHLISKFVSNNEFMKKFEKLQNREINLTTLLK